MNKTLSGYCTRWDVTVLERLCSNL